MVGKKLNLNPIIHSLVPEAPGEIRLFAKLRNEARRIPFFLKYYSRLGVDRFFFVDNGSNDGSIDFLRQAKDAHIFSTVESLVHHDKWVNELLQRYGRGHWCLVVDLDEFFTVPLARRGNLRLLSSYLERFAYDAVEARLLDMYSRSSLRDAVIAPGANPFDVCRFFDPLDQESPYFGGVRRRLFGAAPYLRKYPFFKFHSDMVAGIGMHNLAGARPADILATLFHFKFDSTFVARAREGADSGHYFEGSVEYKLYRKGIENTPDLRVYDEGSIKYRHPLTLIRAGFQTVSKKYVKHFLLYLLGMRRKGGGPSKGGRIFWRARINHP